jgi:imidazolonepropionase-like amidohydrolase
MHHHLDGEFGARLLAEGVTTIRDPGNSPEQIVRWQRQFESGELIGPRVVIAGLIDGKGPFTAPIGTTADTPEQVIAQVREWKKLGAVQIKMYSSLKPELVPVAAKEAHSLGMRVSGHVPAFMTAVDAIHGGYDEIQHVNMLFLNFMFDQVKDTRSTARLVEPAKRAASIDLSSEPVKAFIALLKERGIVSDPTLGTFYDDYCARAGNLESSGYADIADWLPAQNRRALITGGMPVPPGMDQRYKDSAQNMMRMVKLLHDSGVQIVPGTDDTLPGFDLIRELSLYSQAGIPNAEVLQLATFAAPKVMKMTDRFGSLEPGKTADAILVHGDPLADVMALRHVGTTIKGGVLYDTRDLYATAGVKAPMA